MAYDRADWHSGGDYPADLPEENGGTHIGMFLAWIISRGLEGEFHREQSAASLELVRARKMTGREFLFQECDGKFWEEDLSAGGNAFAKAYYEPDDGYLIDYDEVFESAGETMYHVADTWENFDKISGRIDQRHEEWNVRRRGAEHPAEDEG